MARPSLPISPDATGSSHGWATAAMALFAARWFLPAESTAEGATLWLAGGWLCLALVWSVGRLRELTPAPLCFDRVDLAIALIAAPQLLSAIVVITMSQGDGRAAANMAFEWIAILVAGVVLRRMLKDLDVLKTAIQITVGIAVGLSLLGTWQHHVGYREAIASFEALESEWRTAQRTGDAATARRIQSELTSAGVPLDGPARVLWERRLRNSREPYAFFALANTLGGILATVLVLALSTCRQSNDAGTWNRGHVLLVLSTVLIAYCLLLTKSRTAWAGLLCGGCVLAGPTALHWARQFPKRVLLALVFPTTLIAAALATGGLDREVFTEAPKSLAYRLEYWQGALRVIGTQPILGTGPGNFRQHYLGQKIESSSEEIADPHNFILELTATSGLVGLLGLLGAGWLLLGKNRRVIETESGSPLLAPKASDRDPERLTPVLVAAVLGAALAMAPALLVGNPIDWRIPVAALVGLLATSTIPINGLDARSLRQAAAAGSTCLLVHLLGAGGLSRPAMIQLLLLFLAAIRPWSPKPARRATGEPTSIGDDRSRWPAIACAALIIVLLLAGIIPNIRRSTLELLASHALVIQGNPVRSARLLEDAVAVDSLAPGAARQLTRLRLDLATSHPGDHDNLDRAVRMAKETRRRDPHSWVSAHDLARTHRRRWSSTRTPADRQQMIDWGTTAVDLYPSNPRLHAWLASCLVEAKLPSRAANEARYALKLHQVLDRRGHKDKLLPGEELIRLESLAQESEP